MSDAAYLTRLKDCRAVVTGGAKGIGAAIVRRFIAEGARVLICDWDEAAGKALQAETGARFACLDVADVGRVAEVMRREGPFEIAVNNAGVDQHSFFTETTPAEWRKLLAVNLESAFAVTHAVLPTMQAARYGRIVNISSEAGRLGSKGGAVYSAAKAGMIGFSKSIARENARYGITCNTVVPGPIDTPLLRQATDAGGDKLRVAMESATLMKRIGDAEEVAAAVAFLASREASYITGEVLGVSGGMGLG